MKIIFKVALVSVSILVSACGSPLSKEKIAEAETLVMTNAMCEVMGMYRISTFKLNLMHPQQHKDMAYAIYDGAGLSGFSKSKAKNLDDLRGQLDVAFKEDVQELSGKMNHGRQEINHAAEGMFSGLQDWLKKDYGYAYPDCEMAFSMSEAFLSQDL